MLKLNHMHPYFFLRKSVVDPSLGAVHLRVTINQERVVLGAVSAIADLGLPRSMMIKARFWDERSNKVRAACPQAKLLNKAIEECSRRLDKLYQQHEGYDLTMSADKVKELFLNGGRLRPSMPDLIDHYLAERQAMGSPKSTVDTYRFKFRPLLAFLTERNYALKAAEDFTPGMLREFRLYLIVTRKNGERSADKTCQFVKTLLIWAAQSERIKVNPLLNIRIKVDKTPNLECLTQEEVERLDKAQLIPEMRKVADCFRFACFTGLAYQDMQRLTEDNVQVVHGQWCIVGKRKKTGTDYCIPLTEPVEELMQKYGGINLPLPKLGDYNPLLRQIMLSLGIAKRITSHTARKTFCDWLINHLNLSEEAAIVAMGQKDASELAAYRKTRPQRLLSEFPDELLSSRGQLAQVNVRYESNPFSRLYKAS